MPVHRNGLISARVLHPVSRMGLNLNPQVQVEATFPGLFPACLFLPFTQGKL
jgi:hypothetical protein